MNELVKYDEMRLAVERCAAIDEAAGIKDAAQKLEYYAKIRDDKKTETRFAEIKLRAAIQIGKLSRELEKHPQASGGRHDTDDAPSKTDQLKAAGINKRTAQRYEELAGLRQEQAHELIIRTTEAAFAKAAETDTPLTMKALRAQLKDTLVKTVGPIKRKPPPTNIPPDSSQVDEETQYELPDKQDVAITKAETEGRISLVWDKIKDRVESFWSEVAGSLDNDDLFYASIAVRRHLSEHWKRD